MEVDDCVPADSEDLLPNGANFDPLSAAACTVVNEPVSGEPQSQTPKKNKRFPDALEFHMHWSGVDDPELDGDAGHTSTSSSPCSTVGRRSRYRFGYTEIFIHAVEDDVVMNPTPRKPSRSFNIGQGSQPRLCKVDRANDDYRRALELVEYFGYERPKHGYPV